ncbi:unnamed protein product [Brachionus calyciflorus]|uniref:Uncharacterized protein n=1 Tax=Brachionus calyciflorus TaxID=104777 RepID=A0A813R633_9BILA|nr:unnamed protein product [Brachionus calyciflorus]
MENWKIICFLFSLSSSQFLVKNNSKCSKFKSNFEFYQSKLMFIPSIVIRNFNNLSKSKLDCLNRDTYTSISSYYIQIFFLPSEQIQFQNDSLIRGVDTNNIFKGVQYLYLIFNYMNLLNANLKPFSDIKIRYIDVTFSYTKVYLDPYNCTLKNILNYTLFDNIYYLTFDKVEYHPKLCPLIFYNLKMRILKFKSIQNSFISKNIFSFMSINFSNKFKLKSLRISTYKLSLKSDLLNENVFDNLEELSIMGYLDLIDSSTLKTISTLDKLFLDLFDTQKFLIKHLNWLNQLNSSLDKQMTFYLTNREEYKFPNKDFCIYKNFPNFNLIKFAITSTKCTCSILWIRKICDNRQNISCDFEKLIKNCDLFQITKSQFKTDFSLVYKGEYLFYAAYLNNISFYITLTGSIFGFLTNLISMLIVMQKKNLKNKFETKMFDLIKYASITDFLYSFIKLFHLTYFCSALNASYCSKYFGNYALQYLEIYLHDFLGGFLKTFSNILRILVSIFRSITLDKESRLIFIYKFLSENFNLLKKLIFFGVFIVLILFFNVDKLNATVVKFKNVYFDPDYIGFPIKNFFTKKSNFVFNGFYIIAEEQKDNNFYFILFVINFIFNILLLPVLLIIADIYLLLKFRYFMNKSLEIKEKLRGNNPKDQKLKQMEQKKIKISIRIWLNSSIMMFFRMLELSVILYILVLAIVYEFCKDAQKICDNLLDFSNVFYVLSCSYTIVVYYQLSKPFQLKCKDSIRKFHSLCYLLVVKKDDNLKTNSKTSSNSVVLGSLETK